jgi:adenylate cyclase
MEKAAALFERAAELRPDDFSSLGLLADVYEFQGHHELSLQTARRALIRIESLLSQQPTAADVLAMGAATAVYLRDDARAQSWAERAIELEPDNYAVRYNVACAYAVMTMADTAMRHLEYIYSEIPRARSWLSDIIAVDTQFNSLRERPDFKALVVHLRASSQSKS